MGEWSCPLRGRVDGRVGDGWGDNIFVLVEGEEWVVRVRFSRWVRAWEWALSSCGREMRAASWWWYQGRAGDLLG